MDIYSENYKTLLNETAISVDDLSIGNTNISQELDTLISKTTDISYGPTGTNIAGIVELSSLTDAPKLLRLNGSKQITTSIYDETKITDIDNKLNELYYVDGTINTLDLNYKNNDDVNFKMTAGLNKKSKIELYEFNPGTDQDFGFNIQYDGSVNEMQIQSYNESTATTLDKLKIPRDVGPISIENSNLSTEKLLRLNASNELVSSAYDDNQIATNILNINSNATGINNNTTGIADNLNLINTNATRINANTTGIADNLNLINTNATRINANTTGIADNLNLINTNATRINANITGIAENLASIIDIQNTYQSNLSNTDSYNPSLKTGDYIYLFSFQDADDPIEVIIKQKYKVAVSYDSISKFVFVSNEQFSPKPVYTFKLYTSNYDNSTDYLKVDNFKCVFISGYFDIYYLNEDTRNTTLDYEYKLLNSNGSYFKTGMPVLDPTTPSIRDIDVFDYSNEIRTNSADITSNYNDFTDLYYNDTSNFVRDTQVLKVTNSGENDAMVIIQEVDNFGFQLRYDGSANIFHIQRNNGGTVTSVLTIGRNNGDIKLLEKSGSKLLRLDSDKIIQESIYDEDQITTNTDNIALNTNKLSNITRDGTLTTVEGTFTYLNSGRTIQMSTPTGEIGFVIDTENNRFDMIADDDQNDFYLGFFGKTKLTFDYVNDKILWGSNDFIDDITNNTDDITAINNPDFYRKGGLTTYQVDFTGVNNRRISIPYNAQSSHGDIYIKVQLVSRSLNSGSKLNQSLEGLMRLSLNTTTYTFEEYEKGGFYSQDCIFINCQEPILNVEIRPDNSHSPLTTVYISLFTNRTVLFEDYTLTDLGSNTALSSNDKSTNCNKNFYGNIEIQSVQPTAAIYSPTSNECRIDFIRGGRTFGLDGTYDYRLMNSGGNFILNLGANGTTSQIMRLTDNRTAIGQSAGTVSQATSGIAIGVSAGKSNQSSSAIAIGVNAALVSQGLSSVAIGNGAGSNSQGNEAVAIGISAGNSNQGQDGIAIGNRAGSNAQNNFCIAIGNQAGSISQGAQAIAIGASAGQSNQGANSIAIGIGAGQTSQHSGSIILNGSGAPLNSSGTNRFIVKPVRSVSSAGLKQLYYNTTTGEISYAP